MTFSPLENTCYTMFCLISPQLLREFGRIANKIEIRKNSRELWHMWAPRVLALGTKCSSRFSCEHKDDHGMQACTQSRVLYSKQVYNILFHSMHMCNAVPSVDGTHQMGIEGNPAGGESSKLPTSKCNAHH